MTAPHFHHPPDEGIERRVEGGRRNLTVVTIDVAFSFLQHSGRNEKLHAPAESSRGRRVVVSPTACHVLAQSIEIALLSQCISQEPRRPSVPDATAFGKLFRVFQAPECESEKDWSGDGGCAVTRNSIDRGVESAESRKCFGRFLVEPVQVRPKVL